MNFLEFWQENKNVILSFSIFLNIVLLSLTLYLFFTGKDQKCPECVCEQNKAISMNTANDNKTDVNECQSEEKKFYVEVKGEVKYPGVYEADKNSIIDDVINDAGGLTKNAYTDNINMSRKVSDELVIYIYNKNDIKKSLDTEKETNTCSPNIVDSNTEEIEEDASNDNFSANDSSLKDSINEPCLCPTYDITNCTDEKKSEIVSDHSEEEYNKDTWENEDTKDVLDDENDLVNINTASKDELMSLNYIGEAKAKAIIEYRETNGLFKNLEDLKNVKGIGDALFEKIKNYITI